MHIPYGKTGMDFDLPDNSEVLISKVSELKSDKPEDEIVLDAMKKPYGGVTLAEMAQGKDSAVIICSDHTRPVPSRHIIPFMLEELRQGNPDIDITLLIATGFHRATTREELIEKFGEEIVSREKIVIHDSRDPESVIDIGVLPSGAHCVLNRVARDAQLLVSEGFIEPHFFAGFSGGRKAVLPGIVSEVTVLGNHCSQFIADEHARTGILKDNPLHRDMVAAAEIAGLSYIVNVVIDAEKKVVAAFAGDPFKAHEAGTDFLSGYCRVRPKQPGDIVITTNGGYPLDQNVYQSIKGLTAGEAAAAPDGVIIISSSCSDGCGGDSFYEALKNCESPQALFDQTLGVPQDETKPDQWEYQIAARILKEHPVIFVSDPSMENTLQEMKFEYAKDIETALRQARALKGNNAHLVVIPDGVSVMVMTDPSS